MLVILSNIVIFGTNASESFGLPVLLVWASVSLILGVASIIAGKQGWRAFPAFVSDNRRDPKILFFNFFSGFLRNSAPLLPRRCFSGLSEQQYLFW